MKTTSSVPKSVSESDLMALNRPERHILPGAHTSVILEVPYLRSVCQGATYQFKVLSFRLFTASQVFTSLYGTIILGTQPQNLNTTLPYDWHILASSRVQLLNHLDKLLSLCQKSDTVMNWENSQLVPIQRITYLGTLTGSVTLSVSNRFSDQVVQRKSRVLSLSIVTSSSAVVSCSRPHAISREASPSR